MASKDINRATREAIFALPDGANLCATGLDLDPIAAIPIFVTGRDLKQFVTNLEAERDKFKAVAEHYADESDSLWNVEYADKFVVQASISGTVHPNSVARAARKRIEKMRLSVASTHQIAVPRFVDVEVPMPLCFLGRAIVGRGYTPSAVFTGRAVPTQSTVTGRPPGPIDALLFAVRAVGVFVVRKIPHISIICQNEVKLNHA